LLYIIQERALPSFDNICIFREIPIWAEELVRPSAFFKTSLKEVLNRIVTCRRYIRIGC
jgi:hypothetical protein